MNLIPSEAPTENDTDFLFETSDAGMKKTSLNVEKLLSEHQRLHRQIEELEQEIDCLKNSPSWRITTPLRSLKAWLGVLPAILFRSKHRMLLNPFHGLEFTGEEYSSTTAAPYFILESSKRRLPRGWIEITLHSSLSDFSLYYDTGQGFNETQRLKISFADESVQIIELPYVIRTLRLDPKLAGGNFTLNAIEFRERSATGMLLKALLRRYAEYRDANFDAIEFFSELWKYFYKYQLDGLRSFAFDAKLGGESRKRIYQKWLKQEKKLLKSLPPGARRSPDYRPLISLITPVYNTPAKWLRRAIESVLAQDYENFELLLVDDASTRPGVREILEEYARKDSRVKPIFRELNGHISAASNTGLEQARGEFIAPFDHDDQLSSFALSMMVRKLQDDPDLDLIFSDEDRIDPQGQRLDPYFKLGWDPQLLLSQNCISHFALYRASIAKRIKFREGYEGSQDWDFALRFVENTENDRIAHIPGVLYHWRLVPGTVSFSVETRGGAYASGKKAVEDALQRRKISAVVEHVAESGFLKLKGAEKSKSDIVLITDCVQINDSGRHISSADFYREQGGWNFAALTEELQNASEEYLVLAAPGVRFSSLESIKGLVADLDFPESGIVAPRILSSPNRICSTGLLPTATGNLVHAHSGYSADDAGYFGGARLRHSAYAVWQGCFAVKRRLLLQILQDPDAKALSDSPVLLSLLSRKLGLSVIMLPYSEVQYQSGFNRFVQEINAQARRLHQAFHPEFHHIFLSNNSSAFLPF